MVEYVRIKVIVFCKNKEDIVRYRRLFKFMLKDKLSGEFIYPAHSLIQTDELEILFFVGGNRNLRGYRAHYVINMVQDEEFDKIIALPTTNFWHYLKNDPKWAELFDG